MDRILQTLEATEGLPTVQRAAELLVHDPQTLYKAIKVGRLPYVRTLGGSVRLDPDAFATWPLEPKGAR
jgi:excisionase family DNA binding protein